MTITRDGMAPPASEAVTRTVSLTIDDKVVSVPEGTTIWEAARDAGIDIPVLCHDERYDQAAEFLRVWRGFMQGETVEFSGKYLSSHAGRLLFPPVQRPHPPLFIGTSSPAGHQLAAEQADAYLTWGESPAQVAEKIADVRARAAAVGRAFSSVDAAQVAEARAATAEAGKRQRELPTPPPPRWRQKVLWLVAGALVGAFAASSATTSSGVPGA